MALLIQCGKRSIWNPEKCVTPLVLKMLMDSLLPMQQHYFLLLEGSSWWNWSCLHGQGVMSRPVNHPQAVLQLFHSMESTKTGTSAVKESGQTADRLVITVLRKQHSMAGLVWGPSRNLSRMGLLGSVSKRKIMSLKNNWCFSDIFQVNLRCSSMLLLNMKRC